MRELITHGIQQQNWLIAQALTPVLEQMRTVPSASLDAQLGKYAKDGTTLKLMLRPANSDGHFFYVADVPPVSRAQLAAGLDDLEKHGILPQLERTCAMNMPDEARYDQDGGREQFLTSVIPIQTRLGCWVLIGSHSTAEFLDTSIARPYWQTPAVRFAAAIYLALAALSFLIAYSLWRNVWNFRVAAREIREGRGHDHSFGSRSVVPEFASVAADFDELVVDLRNAARDIREAAEDNAHSFKGPVAAIEAAAETLKRQIPPGDQHTPRTIGLITSSVGRLKALIFAAQRLDQVTADLIDTPRTSVNMTQIVADILLRCRDLMAQRGVKVTRSLDDGVFVHAGKGVLEVAVENIVDNAISFSPADGNIEVRLLRQATTVLLQIEDEGPGIDPAKIDRIFERYFSLRTHGTGALESITPASSHSGLGLWIVRRNIESLGGNVSATNRIGGGLSVRVVLPLDKK